MTKLIHQIQNIYASDIAQLSDKERQLKSKIQQNDSELKKLEEIQSLNSEPLLIDKNSITLNYLDINNSSLKELLINFLYLIDNNKIIIKEIKVIQEFNKSQPATDIKKDLNIDYTSNNVHKKYQILITKKDETTVVYNVVKNLEDLTMIYNLLTTKVIPSIQNQNTYANLISIIEKHIKPIIMSDNIYKDIIQTIYNIILTLKQKDYSNIDNRPKMQLSIIHLLITAIRLSINIFFHESTTYKNSCITTELNMFVNKNFFDYINPKFSQFTITNLINSDDQDSFSIMCTLLNVKNPLNPYINMITDHVNKIVTNEFLNVSKIKVSNFNKDQIKEQLSSIYINVSNSKLTTNATKNFNDLLENMNSNNFDVFLNAITKNNGMKFIFNNLFKIIKQFIKYGISEKFSDLITNLYLYKNDKDDKQNYKLKMLISLEELTTCLINKDNKVYDNMKFSLILMNFLMQKNIAIVLDSKNKAQILFHSQEDFVNLTEMISSSYNILDSTMTVDVLCDNLLKLKPSNDIKNITTKDQIVQNVFNNKPKIITVISNIDQTNIDNFTKKYGLLPTTQKTEFLFRSLVMFILNDVVSDDIIMDLVCGYMFVFNIKQDKNSSFESIFDDLTDKVRESSLTLIKQNDKTASLEHKTFIIDEKYKIMNTSLTMQEIQDRPKITDKYHNKGTTKLMENIYNLLSNTLNALKKSKNVNQSFNLNENFPNIASMLGINIDQDSQSMMKSYTIQNIIEFITYIMNELNNINMSDEKCKELITAMTTPNYNPQSKIIKLLKAMKFIFIFINKKYDEIIKNCNVLKDVTFKLFTPISLENLNKHVREFISIAKNMFKTNEDTLLLTFVTTVVDQQFIYKNISLKMDLKDNIELTQNDFLKIVIDKNDVLQEILRKLCYKGFIQLIKTASVNIQDINKTVEKESVKVQKGFMDKLFGCFKCMKPKTYTLEANVLNREALNQDELDTKNILKNTSSTLSKELTIAFSQIRGYGIQITSDNVYKEFANTFTVSSGENESVHVCYKKQAILLRVFNSLIHVMNNVKSDVKDAKNRTEQDDNKDQILITEPTPMPMVSKS